MAKRGPKGPSKWTPEAIEALADRLLKAIEQNHQIMILEQLCAQEGIPLQYISRFKDNPKFCETIKRIEPMLTARLFESAYTGEGNPSIGIFALKNAGTKWRDKSESEVTHKFPTEIKIEFTKPKYTPPDNASQSSAT